MNVSFLFLIISCKTKGVNLDIQEPSEQDILATIKTSKTQLKDMKNKLQKLTNVNDRDESHLDSQEFDLKKDTSAIREEPKNAILKQSNKNKKNKKEKPQDETVSKDDKKSDKSHIIHKIENVLKNNNIKIPTEIIVKDDKKEQVKDDSNKKNKEKIIIVKETKNNEGTVSDEKKKDKETVESKNKDNNLSEMMFTSTIKTKEEILRKKDSQKLIENAIKIKKFSEQIKTLEQENFEILKKFKEEPEHKEEADEKARDITKYKVIEVTEKA